MTSLRVRAVRFEQNGRVFYSTVISAKELRQRSLIDEWSADAGSGETGYQRAPMRSRLREVAAYVEGENAILPLGGLVNARSNDGPAYGRVLRFEADAGQVGTTTSGLLTIPDAIKLYVVDMQHRLHGVGLAIDEDGRADLADFLMPVTVADGLSKLEEVEQFEIINTTQKKVRTDLARRLMATESQDPDRRLNFDRRGRLWEARGATVADRLNREGTIWRGRILPPNKSKTEMPRSIVRETSFVTSLKPILQTPLFQRMPEDQVAIVVDRYWEAVAKTFPEAFEDATSSVIQKTPGAFALHMVAPEIVELVRTSKKELTAKNFAQAMAPWSDFGPGFWSADNEEGAAKYGSMKGFTRLAAELREKLPEVELELS